MTPNRLITLAIHTYDKALPIKNLLEREGIYVELNNVNLSSPEVSSGVRIRIREADLPLALRIVENFEIFALPDLETIRQKGKILVPTDFSDNSFNAMRVAMRVASQIGCEVEFMYAYMEPMNRETIQLSDAYDYQLADLEATQRLQEEAKMMMKRFTERVKAEMKEGKLPAVKYNSIVVEGLPEEAIVEYSREHKPPLIVMGTRAAQNKEADLIGSVSAEVLDSCRVPVITIPENVDTTGMKVKRVAFFCNLDQEDMLAIDALYRFFPDSSLEVTLVHVPPTGLRRQLLPIKQTGENLLKYCREHYEKYQFELSKENLQKIAVNMGQEGKRYDMLCIPNKRKSAIARVFNPSIAHRVIFRADVPMLVIPV